MTEGCQSYVQSYWNRLRYFWKNTLALADYDVVAYSRMIARNADRRPALMDSLAHQ